MPENPRDALNRLIRALKVYQEGALTETERREKERREAEEKRKQAAVKR